MRILSYDVFLLSGAMTLTLLAGCAGGGSQAPPANGTSSTQSQPVQSLQSHLTTLEAVHRVVSPSNQTAFVNVAAVNAPHGNQTIVSDSVSNTVRVYSGAGHLNAILASGLSTPYGLATDAAENLYVANEQNHNILVYAKPYTSARLTLNDAAGYPTGVAVSKAGVVGVTNLQSTANTGGFVDFYAKGSTSPCATIGDANWSGMYFGAFDAAGNLFIDGLDRNGNPLVGEVSGGCAATSITTLSVGNTLYNPAGVQVHNGNILILDQVYNTFSPVIYTYAPPSGGSLGSPKVTTKLSAGIEMLTFALIQNGQFLWIAHSDEANGRIEYTYPGGRFVESFNEDSLVSAAGIAVNPAASP